jgi:hypothetical protein
MVRRVFLASDKFGPMSVEDCQQVVVLDVPERALDLVFAQKPEVSHELA